MNSLNYEALFTLEKDDISRPITTQVLELCETDIFPETIQNSEVTSSSNCCYDENSSFTANLSFPSDVDQQYISNERLDPNNFQSDPNENVNGSTTTSNSTSTTATTTAIGNNNNNNTLSIIFDSHDELDNDIAASIDFSTSPPFSGPYLTIAQQDQFDFSSVEPQVQVSDMSGNGLSVSQYQTDQQIPFMGNMLPSVYEEDYLSMMPPFSRMNHPSALTSYSFLDHSMGTFLPGSLNTTLAGDSSGIFTGTVGSDLQSKEPEYHGDGSGMFCPDQMQRVFNSGDIQSLSNDNQQLVNGAVSNPLSAEISNLEESTFKAGKLSVEQRKEKIHRYMKKRNERNFSKKIKYACRKTLADSRPRVRGRFAKNDDFGDAQRHISSHNEEDEYDDVSIKEEDDMVDSSEIFAHVSGVNSFKCGYPIQSWI